MSKVTDWDYSRRASQPTKFLKKKHMCRDGVFSKLVKARDGQSVRNGTDTNQASGIGLLAIMYGEHLVENGLFITAEHNSSASLVDIIQKRASTP